MKRGRNAQRQSARTVWTDAHTRVAFIFEPGGNAYVGVGSAARSATGPREKLGSAPTSRRQR
jgi:hypothetical protein